MSNSHEDQKSTYFNISREQLYDLIWQHPLKNLTTKIPLSDVGIAKLCKRHLVPRPPQGYWAKIRHGHTVEKPLLPSIKGDNEISIIVKNNSEQHSTHSEQKTNQQKIPALSPNAKRHPTVRDCSKAFKGATADEYGRLVAPRLDMRVSRQSLSRALNLLNTLVLTLEKLDYKIYYSEKTHSIHAEIDNNTLELNIYENSVRTTHIPTQKEINDQVRWSWSTPQKDVASLINFLESNA